MSRFFSSIRRLLLQPKTGGRTQIHRPVFSGQACIFRETNETRPLRVDRRRGDLRSPYGSRGLPCHARRADRAAGARIRLEPGDHLVCRLLLEKKKKKKNTKYEGAQQTTDPT